MVQLKIKVEKKLAFVPNDSIDDKSILVHVMVWHRTNNYCVCIYMYYINPNEFKSFTT